MSRTKNSSSLSKILKLLGLNSTSTGRILGRNLSVQNVHRTKGCRVQSSTLKVLILLKDNILQFYFWSLLANSIKNSLEKF
jgi:hypothetical protein